MSDCNRCGKPADLGMTCVGPRCEACGCDTARDEVPSVWGPFDVEVSEKTRRLWGPLTLVGER